MTHSFDLTVTIPFKIIALFIFPVISILPPKFPRPYFLSLFVKSFPSPSFPSTIFNR